MKHILRQIYGTESQVISLKSMGLLCILISIWQSMWSKAGLGARNKIRHMHTYLSGTFFFFKFIPYRKQNLAKPISYNFLVFVTIDNS